MPGNGMGQNSDKNGLLLPINKGSRKSEKRPPKRKRHHPKDHNSRSGKPRRTRFKGKMNLDNNGEDPKDMSAQDEMVEAIAKREAAVRNMPDGSESDPVSDSQ